MTFDTRTPPKIKEKIENREDFHPGVAEPIDEDTIFLEEQIKNLNYYKVDKATTDSGLSTWILLSGQGSTTNKPPKKTPVVKNVTTTFISEDANKIIKPIFKRKNTPISTTTKKPATTTNQPEKTTKLTKIKASVLSNAMNKNKNEVFNNDDDIKAAALINTTPKPVKNEQNKKTTEAIKKVTEVPVTKKPTENIAVKKTTDAPNFIKKTSEYLTVKKTTEVPVTKKTSENYNKKPTESSITKKTTDGALTKKTTEATLIKKTSENANLQQGTTEVTKKPEKSKTTEAPITKNTKVSQTTEFVKITTKTPNPTNESVESNSVLGPEAKDGAVELPASSKKTRKPTTTAATTTVKRKKTKTKKKKHSADEKSDTKISHKHKEKPIGTQIYNYLSREVMPTVGVGLVGLMVTAGLASYFLYPFSPVRRSYEVDRKDKVATYHYKDEYSGGIAEEEAIGKVIAGMPSNSYNAGLVANSYNRQQNSRNSFQNRYRQVDQRYMQGSVETVQMNPHAAYKIEEVIVGSPKKDFGDSDKRFVVGNVPKQVQEVSTVGTIVPEHGPRTIEEDGILVAKNSQVDVGKENESTSIGNRDKLEAPTSPQIFEHGPRNLEKTNSFTAPTNTQKMEDPIQPKDTRFEPRTIAHSAKNSRYAKPKNTQSEEVFVVHSIPATTETYANHKPRYVRMRRRRQALQENEIDNDVLSEDSNFDNSIPVTTTAKSVTTESYSAINPVTVATTTTTKHPLIEKTESILELIKDLFYYKMRLGLQLLQNKTESLSRYFKRVQERIDENYREQNRDTM